MMGRAVRLRCDQSRQVWLDRELVALTVVGSRRCCCGGLMSEARTKKRGSRGVGRANSSVCSIRVPQELSAQWREYVAHNREEAAEAMRALMRQLVSGKALADQNVVAPEDMKMRTARPEIDRAKKKPLKVYFTESELAALVEVADSRECSIQFLIVSWVRAWLTRGVALGGIELKALGESLYQLTAIGRNLNQVTHHINADPDKNLHRITVRSIERLLGVINAHRVATHGVIEANTHRWKIS